MIVGYLVSLLGMCLTAIYKRLTSKQSYEAFIKRELPCSSELYNQCQQPPNLVEEGVYITCETRVVPTEYPNPVHRSSTKGINIVGSIDTVAQAFREK